MLVAPSIGLPSCGQLYTWQDVPPGMYCQRGSAGGRILLVDSKDVSFGILGVNQPSNAEYGQLGDYYGAAVGDDLIRYSSTDGTSIVHT